ncbi:peptide chain release factor N(5)-glutamine methyltransferase [Haloimpatiens sp. FM7330]|uniref:peptide chain release factor N(5)-glutamine methyltransferase n=1 Tax=Haloimpatiens sp. FM7330 TaxID=3298610 RepID=UPI00363C96E3
MNIGEILNKAYDILKQQNIETYILDSQLLLCKVLQKDKLFLILNRDMEVNDKQISMFLKYVNLRKDKMPIKYILGECEFMGLNFFVKKGVLIPRPDTEILVEQMLKTIKKGNYKNVCDVCCGSGAIGISLAKLADDVKVVCSDIAEEAREVTLENIKRLDISSNVKFVQSDLLQFAIEKGNRFDIIVSNPPYIEENVIDTLMKDVKDYEPYIALCGGKDGLDFYRKITFESVKVLNDDGILAFEIGYNQKEKVKNILKNNGFSHIRCIKDLAGLDRVIIGKIIL